jgi:hypothetical protein
MLRVDVDLVFERAFQIFPTIGRLGAGRAQPLVATRDREAEILCDAFVEFEFGGKEIPDYASCSAGLRMVQTMNIR